MRKLLPVLLNFFLSAGILWVSLSLYTFYRESKNSLAWEGEEKQKEVFTGEGSKKDMSYYRVIYKRNLFPAPGKKLISSIKPEEKKINLKLKGTVTGREELSFAVIEDEATHREDLYHLGDMVKDMKIMAINSDSVTLKKGEEEIVLMLEEGAAGKAILSSPTVRVVPRQEVEEAINRVREILSQVRISPYFKKGKMEGFRVSYVVPGSLVEKMGVKKGDIIRSVNKEILDTPGKVFQLYKKLRDASRIEVEVVRDGVRKTLLYQIQG